MSRARLPRLEVMDTERCSQARCDDIAGKLNSRPRKRVAFLTPAEVS